MKTFPTKISSLISSILTNRELIFVMSKRSIIGKYRGSLFGLLWSFFNPLIMLSVYTFAFSVVFKAKWGDGSGSHIDFAIIIFCSLIVFNIFSDTMREAPMLITMNPSYVKKVIFPLEILPLISLIASIFHAGISIIIFSFFQFLIHFSLPWTFLFFPIIITPLLLFTLGCSFLLASLGVFFRDIGQMIGHITTILMFTSPIFFSMKQLPVQFQKIVYLNPIAFILEESRKVLIFGEMPDWGIICIYTLVGFINLCFGYFWFQKTRNSFADVL